MVRVVELVSLASVFAARRLEKLMEFYAGCQIIGMSAGNEKKLN